MKIKDNRIFLDWNSPPLPQLVQELLAPWSRQRDIDLRSTTILLPTARSGRRLLELLLDTASKEGQLLLPPQVVTPGALYETLYKEEFQSAADPLTDQLSWIEAVIATDVDQLGAFLQSVTAAPLTFANAKSFADLFIKMHRELAAYNINFHDLQTHPLWNTDEENLPGSQSARWGYLNDIYQRHKAILLEQGLIDPQEARTRCLQHPLPQSCSSLIVAFCPDITPQLCMLLDAWIDRIQIYIHAPFEEKHAFTNHGRIQTTPWLTHITAIPANAVEVLPSASQEALAIIHQLADIGVDHSLDQVTIGLANSELRPSLHAALHRFGVPFFDADAPLPPLASITSFLKALIKLGDHPSRSHVFDLLRHPQLQRFIADHTDSADLLTTIDLIESRSVQELIFWAECPSHHPTTPSVDAILVAIQKAISTLLSESAKPVPYWSTCIAETLDILVPGEILDPPTRSTITRVLALLRETRSTKEVTGIDALRLFHDLCDNLHTPETDSDPAVDIVGWLELHLDDAPKLLVAGFVDGAVPEIHNSDPYLPNTARNLLHLPSNETRLARDIYLLAAILRSRSVLFSLSKTKADGSLSFPSRLFYQGESAATVEHARRFYLGKPKRLFVSSNTGCDTGNAFIPARPPEWSPPEHMTLPVTAIASYLNCPYRFYLTHLERIRALSDQRDELPPPEFGTILHAAIQGLENLPKEIYSSNTKLHRHLCSQLHAAFEKRYGKHPNGAVLLQLDAAAVRLRAFAEWQTSEIEAGWIPIYSEYILDTSCTTFVVDGTTIALAGRIDRIDKHRDGTIRIVDLKTGNRTPSVWHPERGWKDPQLPLYGALLLRHPEFRDMDANTIQFGYILLNKQGTIQYESPKLPELPLHSAVTVTAEVLGDIVQGVFWPPNQISGIDDFSRIVGKGIPGFNITSYASLGGDE